MIQVADWRHFAHPSEQGQPASYDRLLELHVGYNDRRGGGSSRLMSNTVPTNSETLMHSRQR